MRFVAWGWASIVKLTWVDGLPNPTPELLERGSACLEAGDLDNVIVFANQALAFEADNACAFYLRTVAHRGSGARKQAHSDASKLLELTAKAGQLGSSGFGSPEWRARAWLLMGQTAWAIDDEPGAFDAFEEVDRIASGRSHKGDVLHLLNAEALEARWDFVGALAALDRGHAGPEMARTRATLLRRHGEVDRAIETLTAALATAKDRSLSDLLVARWGARLIRGDPRAAEDLSSIEEVGQADGAVQLAQAFQALLDDDRARAREVFGQPPPTDAFRWRWATLLGMPPSSKPPVAVFLWERAVDGWLLGALADDELLSRALEASGPRSRAVQLHEGHVFLALAANATRDREREVKHLHAAAAHGDMGGGITAWIHARARQLGAPVEHRSPHVTLAS